MNSWVKGSIGVSIAGFFVLLATYGAQVAEATHALWLLMLKASEEAPLGLASFMAALALATLSRWFLRKWTPHHRHLLLPRDFLIDLGTLLIGITVVWLQMKGGDAVARLNALWIGLAAGLFAPLLYGFFAAVWALVRHSMSASEKPPGNDAGGPTS